MLREIKDVTVKQEIAKDDGSCFFSRYGHTRWQFHGDGREFNFRIKRMADPTKIIIDLLCMSNGRLIS